MRRVTTGAAVILALAVAGCSSGGPSDNDSRPPSPAGTAAMPSTAGSTVQVSEAALSAVCDALDETVKLPGDGTVTYNATFHHSTTATTVPMCDIEPEGEYFEVAGKAALFGRAEFNYGIVTDAQLQQDGHKYPKYTPETAEKLLSLDQADPVADSLPCAAEPCKNGIHGYQYNFRFETILDNIAVDAQFDYITTDVKGDKQAQYRTHAIEEFKTSMDIIATRLK